eukprot:GHVS01029934.1.p1 GENE.GHVS01029934.1~~GHVS01029934.1.p1  ORF type:complete len:222 (-),score=32.01 GHVS01029934.1:1716-2381(-)
MEGKRRTEIDVFGRALSRASQRTTPTWQLPPTCTKTVTVMQPHQQPLIRCYKQQTTVMQQVPSGNGKGGGTRWICYQTEEEQFHPSLPPPVFPVVPQDTQKHLCAISPSSANLDNFNGFWRHRLPCLVLSFYTALCDGCEAMWAGVKYMWDSPRYAVAMLLCVLAVLVVCFSVVLFKQQQRPPPPGWGDLLAKLHHVASGNSPKNFAKTANKVLQFLLTEL